VNPIERGPVGGFVILIVIVPVLLILKLLAVDKFITVPPDEFPILV
jgi:hypothetical protein